MFEKKNFAHLKSYFISFLEATSNLYRQREQYHFLIFDKEFAAISVNRQTDQWTHKQTDTPSDGNATTLLKFNGEYFGKIQDDRKLRKFMERELEWQ